MATYTKLEDKVNNRKIQVESAVRDGAGRNIENNYAKQDGYYANLGAGTSDVTKAIESDRQIDNPEVACPPIVFGTTGGEAEITSGFSKLESISGNTIKWGQLLDGTQCSTSSGTFTYDASTHLFHYVKDNSEGSSYDNTVFSFPAQRISEHIYYVRFRLVSGNLGISNLFIVNSSQSNLLVNPILSPRNTTDQYTQFVMSIPAGAVGDFYCTLEMFDLTNIYGLGQEISDAEEFDRVYPNYYPYSPNVILSTKPYQLISRQKNQCSGLDQFIRVVPNTEYELSGITAGGILEEYDADKNLINTTSDITSTLDITLSANTYYVKIKATTSNDVMFYITWGVYNEPYEPYEEESVDLPNIELLRVYDTKDEAYQAGGGIRRIGVIDLGTLTVFDYRSELHTYRIQIPHMRKPNKNNETWKHTNCAEYDVNNTNYTLSLSNMSFCTIENASGIYIKNDACSTPQEMQSALSGILLYYILDTPTGITTEENPGWQEFVKTNNFGTIEFTTNPQQVPQVLQSYFIKYTVNLVEFLDSAYVKTEGDGNNIALQSDLNVVESDVEGLKNGSIPAKLADNLTPYSEDSGVYQSIPFNSQGTGCGNGETQVDTGSYALVKEIRGNGIRYNQLIRLSSYSRTAQGVTITPLSGRRFKLSGTATADIVESDYFTPIYATEGNEGIKGHTYLFFNWNSENKCTLKFIGKGYQGPHYTISDGCSIATPSYGIYRFELLISSGTTFNDEEFEFPACVDLTTWFNGNDMIPAYLLAHPETFLRYYDGALDYGVDTIKFANATQIISTGRQQWDEEWEVGTINPTTGENMTDAGRIRSKNFIELIPATKYYIRNNSSASALCQTFYYDANKQFISSKSDEHNEILRPPESARYLRISPYAAYGNTYTNDITISLYYDGESGYDEYYPYEVLQTIDIDTSKLRRARNAYDSQLPNGRLSVQRIKSVDLGTLTWHKAGTPTEQSGGKGYYYFSNAITDSVGWGTTTLANLLVEGYDVALFGKVRWITYTPTTPTDNSVITIYNNPKSVNIYNPAFDTPEMTVEEVTNALSGVILYYELAEPILTDSTPYAEALKIDDFGSTKNVSTSGVPQGNLIFYPVDYKAYVDTLVNHTDGDATSIALKSDLADKIDKVSDANKIYGTDSNGNQTTYDKDSFGQVDDVQFNGVSVVSNKVANIELNIENGDGGYSLVQKSSLNNPNIASGHNSGAFGSNIFVLGDYSFGMGSGGQYFIDDSRPEIEQQYQRTFLNRLKDVGGDVSGSGDEEVGETGILDGNNSISCGLYNYTNGNYNYNFGNQTIISSNNSAIIGGLLNTIDDISNKEISSNTLKIRQISYEGFESGNPGIGLYILYLDSNTLLKTDVPLGSYLSPNTIISKSDGNSAADIGGMNVNYYLRLRIPYGRIKAGATSISDLDDNTVIVIKGSSDFTLDGNTYQFYKDIYLIYREGQISFNTCNISDGNSNFICGGSHNDIFSGVGCVIGGIENKVYGANEHLLYGHGLIAAKDNTVTCKTILGIWNNNKVGTLLEIGNGTNRTDGRHNAFEVTKEGVARAYGTISGIYDLTPKSYVDEAISTAISTVYKIQGSYNISTLNGLTKNQSMNGYVYDLTDAGNLVNQDSSTISVSAGDNVVFIWNNGSWKWDKLAANIDLSGYVQKTTTIAGVDLQDNITANELKTALSLDNVANAGSSATPIENGTDNFTTGGAYTELAKYVPTSRKVAGNALTSDIAATTLLNSLVDTASSSSDDTFVVSRSSGVSTWTPLATWLSTNGYKKIDYKYGTFTVAASAWANNSVNVTISGIQVNDTLNLSGASVTDINNMTTAGVLGEISAANTLTLTVATTPTADIVFKYTSIGER